MPHIIQLDRHVADLIAAGEVVERPASAVKELVENAVDAGATQITVELQNGGMTFLRITDNGCGISPEDAPTAFLRHATSKIRTREDLAAISTLGFRGEALAAISSVSRIDLLTHADGCEGTSLHLEAGVLTAQQPAGCPRGTTIIVRDLFYNTPARMKFMKSDAAESSAIAAVVQQQALAHPAISFRLIRDGETQFQTPGDGERLSAVYTVFGRELAKNMLAVNGAWEKFRVTGYVSRPTATRGNRALQYFFLNGRFIRSRLLSAALEEAYRNQRMVGRFPACVLELTMPLEAVDVNVHPAKTEVKFLNERAAFDAVHYAVLSTLSNASGRAALNLGKPSAEEATPARAAQPSAAPAAGERPTAPAAAGGLKIGAVRPNFYQTMQAEEYRRQVSQPGQARLASQIQYPTRASSAQPSLGVQRQEQAPKRETKFDDLRSAEAAPAEAVPEETGAPETARPPISGALQSDEPKMSAMQGQTTPAAAATASQPQLQPPAPAVQPALQPQPDGKSTAQGHETNDTPEQLELPLQTRDYRLIGEAFNSYFIVEQDDNVLFIDKHAAHERVLFEKLKAEDHPIVSQQLVAPLSAELTREESAIVLENTEILEKCGFEVSDFGDGDVLIRQIPCDVDEKDAISLLQELSADLLSGKTLDPGTLRDNMLHTIACKAAIKAGWHTEPAEADHLVREILSRTDIKYCPHGRPVCIELSKKRLESQFKRT